MNLTISLILLKGSASPNTPRMPFNDLYYGHPSQQALMTRNRASLTIARVIGMQDRNNTCKVNEKLMVYFYCISIVYVMYSIQQIINHCIVYVNEQYTIHQIDNEWTSSIQQIMNRQTMYTIQQRMNVYLTYTIQQKSNVQIEYTIQQIDIFYTLSIRVLLEWFWEIGSKEALQQGFQAFLGTFREIGQVGSAIYYTMPSIVI